MSGNFIRHSLDAALGIQQILLRGGIFRSISVQTLDLIASEELSTLWASGILVSVSNTDVEQATE